MEDSFPTDRVVGDGFGVIEVHYREAHLPLCSPVPNRPGLVLVCSAEVGDSGHRGCCCLDPRVQPLLRFRAAPGSGGGCVSGVQRGTAGAGQSSVQVALGAKLSDPLSVGT